MPTDPAAALANPVGTLSAFEGRDVLRSAIEVPNAGGGLEDAMAFEPRELHHGEEGTIVLRYKVSKVRFDPIKGTECLLRVQVLHATEATFIESEVVDEALRQQRERIEKLREEAAGIQRLGLGEVNGDGMVDMTITSADPDEEAPEVALARQHSAGVHSDGLREGCEACQEEADAAAAEAEQAAAPTPIGRKRK